MEVYVPSFNSDDAIIYKAFHIAVCDLAGNVELFKNGLLQESKPVIMVGLDYD